MRWRKRVCAPVKSCAQFACATEQISDPINTIRTQACQSKLILINASRDVD